VIIMSDEKLRNKYFMLLGWRVQAFAMANATLALLAVATYLTDYRHRSERDLLPRLVLTMLVLHAYSFRHL
jgi:hypothetical protein